MRPVTVSLLAFFVSMFCFGAFASNPKTDVIERAITEVIHPGFEQLAKSTERLKTQVGKLCTNPSLEKLQDARTSFAVVVSSWGRVEFVRPGPLSRDNLVDRFLFWPDRRSRGLRQVQKALNKRDQTVLKQEALAQKSVGLQGLGAMEFLLFGTGSDALSGDVEEFRCGYALAVSKNLQTMAERVTKNWDAPSGYARTWSEPSAANPVFKTENEALSQFIGMIASGLEQVRDQRLKPILARAGRPASHKRALFWRSDQTLGLFRSNLAGLRALVMVSSMKDLLPSDERWLHDTIEFEFDNALAALDQISLPVKDAVYDDEAAAKLAYLAIVVRSLQAIIGEQFSTAAGLPIGFSPLDGD